MPKLATIMEDSDSEPEPDAVVNIPINKVKLVVGPGGEMIKHIQRKSKARLQVPGPVCSSHVSCQLLAATRPARPNKGFDWVLVDESICLECSTVDNVISHNAMPSSNAHHSLLDNIFNTGLLSD